ncbi:MAG: hypothetical protein K9G36_11100 [Crocinitomicaceae bacterium]|nr:hypothetical protein [Crocinitomicaceae bacterium]
MDIKNLIKYSIVVIVLISLLFFVIDIYSIEMNWSIFDYSITSVLLFILLFAMLLISTSKLTRKIKWIFLFAFIFSFMLVWIELAVGIFNSPFAGN